MTKGEFVMVLVIEYVEEIAVEGMDVFDFGEVFEDVEEFLVKSFLAEFDFSHVEGSDAADGIAWVDDCGCFSLGFWKDDVDEFRCGRDHLDGFEIVTHWSWLLKIEKYIIKSINQFYILNLYILTLLTNTSFYQIRFPR